MIRTKKSKTVDLIITSDWHLREDTPVCYIGDFWNDQWEAVDFISELQKKYECPVIHAGDLFDHWKPSPFLLSKTIEHLPIRFYTVYGQHDLPQHNLELRTKSGIYTLEKADILSTEPPINSTLDFCSWNTSPHQVEPYGILIWHKFNYQGKLPWPGCTSPTANKLLKDYPYDLIVTGDNHKSFVETYQGRLLVNPGSLMRQDADQIDFHPCVYLYHAEDNTVTKVELPFKEGVISRDHIEKVNQKNERLEAYISKLNDDWNSTLSFDENLEIFQQKNKVEKSVMEIIYKSIELKLK